MSKALARVRERALESLLGIAATLTLADPELALILRALVVSTRRLKGEPVRAKACEAKPRPVRRFVDLG